MNGLFSYLWTRYRKSKGLAHLFWMVVLAVAADGYWFGFAHVKYLLPAGNGGGALNAPAEPRADRERELHDPHSTRPVTPGRSGFVVPPRDHEKRREEHEARPGWGR